MKNTTAEQVMQKWAAAGAASATAVKAGVNAVQESPTAKAARQVDVWAANVAKAKDKFVSSLNRVSLQDWKNAMLGKGIANMEAGYADRFNQTKFLSFMRVFLPYVREGAMRVRSMPKGTRQQSIDRMVEMMDHNRKFPQTVGIAPPPRPVGGGGFFNN